jgi:nicotinamide-nucleotide amidase
MDANATGAGATTAAIIAVGDELLFGETVDTNSAWLGRTFAGWGVRVVRGLTVPDRVEAIQDALRAAVRVADLVIVTGGLGPTDDDVTKAAAAQLVGASLVVDDEVRAAIRGRFRASGRETPPRLTESQAEILEGSVALANDVGTAPGILFELEGRPIVLVPGVPAEMRSIVSGPLRDALDRRGLLAERVHHRSIHTTGVPESRLAELMAGPWREVPPELREGVGLAYLPDELGVDLRLSVGGLDGDEAESRLDALEAAIGPVVAPWRFVAESGDLAEAVAVELRRLGLTLATAESCTGGLVAARITRHAGASDVFLGGIVSYANEVKVRQLGVSEEDLQSVGAVSEAVAVAMASGVTELLGSDTGIAITGVAGPGGGSEDKPVGTVWIAVAVEGKVEAVGDRFAGDRGTVRRQSTQAALALLYRRLVDMPAGPDRGGAT